MIRFLKTYLLPGLVFQSIVIGGGYGTGRELVEFFLKEGPVGGLLAMATATVIWSTVIAISFELARRARAFDYRSFVRTLLGPGWLAYELVYVTSTVLILSVVAAASSEILGDLFGLDPISGAFVAMALVGAIVYFGTPAIEKLFAAWSILLYIAYFVLVVWCFKEYGPVIRENIGVRLEESNWLTSGIRFASYNIGGVPIVLVCARIFTCRREAIIAGLLCGPIAMLPGLFLYLALISQYPGVLHASIPTAVIVATLGSGWFQIVFTLLLLGTVVDTGAAMVHGLNERIAVALSERHVRLTALKRGVVGVSVFAFAVFAAGRIGLIDLIAKGYGTVGWFGAAIFVLPVLTVGAWRVIWTRDAAG